MENTPEKPPQDAETGSESLAIKVVASAAVCAMIPFFVALRAGALVVDGVDILFDKVGVDTLVDKVTDGMTTIKEKVTDAVGNSEMEPQKKEKLAAAAQIAGGVYSGLSGILMLAGRGFMGSFAKRHHIPSQLIAKGELEHAQKSVEEGMKRWNNAPKA